MSVQDEKTTPDKEMDKLDLMSLQVAELGHKLRVKWAPFNTPVCRRLQTFAAFLWFTFFVFGGFAGWFLVVYAALCTRFWWLSLAYVAWILIDKDTSQSGSRWWPWMRRLPVWQYLRDYFPVTLVKTAELDTNRNYLLCAYPHGVLSAGVFTTFATDAVGVRDLFPGMTPNIVTLHQHFMSPFIREIGLGLGGCSATKRGITNVLSDSKGGRMAVLVVGGAAESLLSRPSKYHVVLKRRRGFCRIALQQGTPLVPVFVFGENKLYDQVDNPEGSRLLRIQEKLRGMIGLAPVIPIGRGFFQYSFGLLPRRFPVTVVVGAPVEVERVEEPTKEQIDALHEKFTTALVDLFATHSPKYHGGEHMPLIID